MVNTRNTAVESSEVLTEPMEIDPQEGLSQAESISETPQDIPMETSGGPRPRVLISGCAPWQ